MHSVRLRIATLAALCAACASAYQQPRTVKPGERDDPATCLDVEGWSPDDPKDDPFKRSLRARIAELHSCGRALTQQAEALFHVSCAPGVAPKVVVARTTVEDCSVVECYRRGLASLACPSSDKAHVGISDDLGPASLPPSSATSGNEANAAGKCADPAPNSDALEHGPLDPPVIQAAIRGKYADFRHCYESGLARNPHLTGKVMARFVIGRDGHVSQAQIVSNTLPDCTVTTCMRNGIQSIVFPPPTGDPVTVVYPILFEPGEDKPTSANASPKAPEFKGHP